MRIASVLLGPLLFTACADPANDTEHAQGEPFRDEWRVELSAPVTLAGAGRLQDLLVGGHEHESNFANRGDVIVQFHDEDRIVVEMRRFTRAADPERAREDFDHTMLWAYIGGDVAPVPPQQMEFPRPCVGEDGSLRDGCGLRVYYDGNSQPLRTGADLRVTLPARWTGQLDLITQDSIIDSDYLNRGNICVEPTRAWVTAQLERGVAYASIAPDEVAPGTASLSISGDAAQIWLDVPAQLRTSWRVGYEDDQSKQERCFADPVLEGHVFTEVEFGSKRSSYAGVAGPDPETETFDALLAARSDTCDVVAFTEAPDQWSGEPNEQSVETRGEIRLCNDCIAATPCEELLPGQ